MDYKGYPEQRVITRVVRGGLLVLAFLVVIGLLVWFIFFYNGGKPAKQAKDKAQQITQSQQEKKKPQSSSGSSGNQGSSGSSSSQSTTKPQSSSGSSTSGSSSGSSSSNSTNKPINPSGGTGTPQDHTATTEGSNLPNTGPGEVIAAVTLATVAGTVLRYHYLSRKSGKNL